ncbi:MAG: hypothetical protein EON60_11520 [Alphaproteobacteria bacterium]|nr:MAG: hypothetical protein EON60_11520 [Alphaproteobacteria bacterium]
MCAEPSISMDAVLDFLNWYMAPWRRIGRKEYGIGLTLATLPGLFMMVFGWGSSAGSFLAPLQGLMSGGGDPEAMLQGLQALQNGGDAAAAGFTIDWSGVVNGLLLLALVPLGRMRLRDMGWFGWQEIVLTVAFNISVVGGLILALTGYDVVPMGMLWSIVNFVGYGWMTFAKGKPRADVHARTNYDKPVGQDKRIDDDY